MRELFLIRHGESEHHLSGMAGGWTDYPLTSVGRRQAQLAGERLSFLLGSRTVSLYTSDLARALDTAKHITEFIPATLQVCEQLRKLRHGREGGSAETATAALPVPPSIDWVPCSGAESWRMMFNRISYCMNAIEAQVPGTAIVVSHANAIICIVNWWLRISEDHHLASIMYDADPGGITRLRVDSAGCRTVAFLNDTSHLKSDNGWTGR